MARGHGIVIRILFKFLRHAPSGYYGWITSVRPYRLSISIKIIGKTALTFINYSEETKFITNSPLCIYQPGIVIGIQIRSKVLSYLKIDARIQRNPVILALDGHHMLIPKFPAQPKIPVF